jgi:hypothetical protein
MRRIYSPYHLPSSLAVTGTHAWGVKSCQVPLVIYFYVNGEGIILKFILLGETLSNLLRNTANTNGESEIQLYVHGEGKLSKFTTLGETLFNTYAKLANPNGESKITSTVNCFCL